MKAKKILVVEDEKTMARALELKLQGAGFEVKMCYNGQDCLDLCEKEKFDLILLDLVMPVKDGFAVLQEIKTRKDTTPVIVLSNLGQEEDAKRAKELGAKDYVIKSDTPIAEVVERVKKILVN